MNQFATILKRYKYILNKGDIVAGTILHEEYSGFLVNIGTKLGGYLPKEEITITSKNKHNHSISLLNITREFFLLTTNVHTKQSVLSIKRLEYIRAWKRIKQIYSEDILFKLQIQYINKGGFITYLEGIQGFIPKSHIDFNKMQITEISKKSIQGKNIECKLLTAIEQKNQVILSNKSAIFTLCPHRFKLGEIVYGKIVFIKSYGLFLSIYGVNALLHISEIGSIYIKNINLVFKTGTLIKVKILHINSKQGKIFVSRRSIE
uniref:Ribosomal protein S1 n=1 Tax=Digenea simplex TaxID=945030 RepID=A0A1Z1MU42_DIGSM|nr:ribosomal protein S1 [Digenea simplex]ARW69627.1 ribosomal protein S1 [Digenea simplex]